MDNESAQDSVQTENSDSTADTNSEAFLIASGGAAGTPEEVQDAGSTDSPSEAKPVEKQAVEEGQQTDETEVKDEDVKSDDETAESQKDETVSEDQKPDDAEKVIADETRKRLNLIPQEPETIDTLQEKYKQSSRESHRLNDFIKARDKYLSDTGIQLIEKDDGSLGIIATDKYAQEIDVGSVVKSTINSLSEDQKIIFESDEAAVSTLEAITKDIANKVLSKRPPVNATIDDVRLPNREVDSIFDGMSKIKIGEGDDAEPLYPDMANEDVGKLMFDLFQDPSARDFYIAANKNPENMKWYLDALHGRIFRARAPLLAKQADAQRQKEQAKLIKQKDASVSTDGAAGSGDATQVKSENEAERIAKSGNTSAW